MSLSLQATAAKPRFMRVVTCLLAAVASFASAGGQTGAFAQTRPAAPPLQSPKPAQTVKAPRGVMPGLPPKFPAPLVKPNPVDPNGASARGYQPKNNASALVPQRAHPMTGNGTYVPADIPVRDTRAVPGFGAAAQKATGRVQIGGSSGAAVQEQVVNLTQTPSIDERTPVWTADERFIYYASSPQNGTNPRFGLYRISSVVPAGVVPNTGTAITNPADTTFDYYFPAINANSTRVAFVRSSDGLSPDVPSKRFELYVSDIPGTGQFIDTAPNGVTNLRTLVQTVTTPITSFPNGAGGRVNFTNIGRPSWIGSNDLVFSGQLANDPNYHLFTINVETRLIFQLTGRNGSASADERNPAVSPDGRYIAFDSDAAPNATGGTYNNAGTRVRSETDPAAQPAGAPGRTNGARNIFYTNVSGQNVLQFTNQYTNAPDVTNVQPTWTSQQNNQFTNLTGQNLFIGFASSRVPTFAPSDATQSVITGFAVRPNTRQSIYYVQFTANGGATPSFEGTPTDLDGALPDGARLIDTGNTTATPTLAGDRTQPRFLDQYPSFAPFLGVFRVAIQSNREGTYQKDSVGLGFTPSPLNNIFIASVIDISAPTLIRYDTSSPTGEVVHVNLVTNNNVPFNPSLGASVRARETGITPNANLFFTVRVEDREAGMRPENSRDGGAVYLIIKNPNSKYQSTAQGGFGVEHKEFGAVDSFGRFFNQFTGQSQNFGNIIDIEGTTVYREINFATGYTLGQEYEAQAISAADRTTYFTHRGNDFGDGPLYIAGLDDQNAFAGSQFPPLDGGTYSVTSVTQLSAITPPVVTVIAAQTQPNIWLRLKPLVQQNADGTPVLDNNGNTIPLRPQDGLGGVLYGAQWQIPAEASDWYLDVVLYDNAVNPFETRLRSNFIIYDNVWGFSSANPISGQPTDVLMVSDYTLGQKFFNSRFGDRPIQPATRSNGSFGFVPNNILPVYFGAESYYTDRDMSLYPSEQTPNASTGTAPIGYDTFGPFNVNPQTNGLVFGYVTLPGRRPGGTTNPLGVASYNDELQDDGAIDVDGYRLPPTGRYSIWRILARGPVPASLLQDYLPQQTQTPPDTTTGETATRTVLSANRMVVWASPFSGDLFVGTGSITDIETQNNLTNFVNAGGRLFISGQDLGYALSGSTGGSNAFFNNVLKAQFVSDNVGLVAGLDGAYNTGLAGFGYTGQLQHDPWDPSTARHAYGFFGPPVPFPYSAPDDTNAPNNGFIRITNNLGGSLARSDGSRTSGAGAGFAGVTGNDLRGKLDVIRAKPTATATTATMPPDSIDLFLYNGSAPAPVHVVGAVPTVGAESAAIIASSLPAGTSPVGLPQPFVAGQAFVPQGKVAYCAMGFESISDGWYTYGSTTLATLGRRAEIMHNITSSFRTGTMLGRVVDNNGAPVSGVLVRAILNFVGNQNNAASGTALTDNNGNFQIVGLQPGFYVLFGSKPGFYTQHSTGNAVDGGWRAVTNIALKVAGPGALSGIANNSQTNRNAGGVFSSDGVTPIAGIEVQVRREEPDGSFTEIATISSNGVSSPLPAGGYQFPTLLITDPQFGYIVIANARTKVVNGRIVPKDKDPLTGKYLASENVNEGFGEVRVLSATQPTIRVGPGTIIDPNPLNPTVVGPVVVIKEGVTSQIDFLLPSAPQAVQGKVVEQGTNTPIAGATVTATLLNSTVVVAQAVTDANGNYTLSLVNPVTGQDPTLLPGGTYVIHADANGYNLAVPPSVNDVQVAVGGGSTLPFATAPTIQLAALPPGSVSGLVQLNNGTILTTSGAAGATVSFYAVSTVGNVDQQSTTATFTATVAATPTVTADNPPYQFNYSVASVKPGRYNAYVNKPGLAGSPNPFANVVITAGTETRNINFTLEPPRIYGAGVQLISVPFDYSAIDPRTIFGLVSGGDNNGNGVSGEAADQTIYDTFDVADWTGTDYNIAPNIPLRLGKGYFVRFGAISVVTAPSGGTARGAFTVNLSNGWNLIGHPFDNRANPGSPAPDINLTDPTVTTFSYTTTGAGVRTNVSLAQAVADGVVGSVAYSYTGSNGGSTYVQTGLIRPFFGYWFHANAAVQMTFQYPDPTFRSVNGTRTGSGPSVIKATRATGGKFVTQTRAELDKPVFRSITSKGLDNWRLQIAAQQGDLKDSDNSIGVSADAKNGFDNRYDNEKPPMMNTADADSLYLGVKGVNASGKATDFSDMVQNAYAGSGSKSWEFSVQTTNPGKGEVTLTWPNAARLPRGVEPVLIDTVSGKRFNMRTGGSSFRFTPSAGRAQHTFRVEVAPPATTPLDLVNVRVSRTQGSGTGRAAGGFRFAFTATRDADITAEVQTMTGKVVRTLSTRAVRGTEASVQWDGRSAIGADVPAGVYMLRLTARDSRAASGGAQVTRQVPIMTIR